MEGLKRKGSERKYRGREAEEGRTSCRNGGIKRNKEEETNRVEEDSPRSEKEKQRKTEEVKQMTRLMSRTSEAKRKIDS